MNLVINAANVRTGGGFGLLSALLESLSEGFQGRLILDERLQLPVNLPENLVVYRIRPTIWARLRNEWYLRRSTEPDDSVLCFGNLPPIFRLRGKVLLFLQNRYLVEPRSLKGFPFFHRLRITLERIWFRWGKRNVTRFIVQTPSMQRTVERNLRMPSTVLPFSKNPKGYTRAIDAPCGTTKTKHGLLYVASGEPHKNHRTLVEAWTLLAEEGIKPGLCLTLDKNRFPDLCGWIEDKAKDMDLNVTNVGSISAQDLERIYKESLALIYPSDFESLGLPLIEARCAGLPILASERDYVRDDVDPEETFDPGSPVSIARAVKRFLGIPEKPLPLLDAREFLSKVYEIAKR
jgi:glycosyltransferase involved in cell wall biosynthesis